MVLLPVFRPAFQSDPAQMKDHERFDDTLALSLWH